MPSCDLCIGRHLGFCNSHVGDDLVLSHLPRLHASRHSQDQQRFAVRSRSELRDCPDEADRRGRRRGFEDLFHTNGIEPSRASVHKRAATGTADEVERVDVAPRRQKMGVSHVGELRRIKDMLLQYSRRLYEAGWRATIKVLSQQGGRGESAHERSFEHEADDDEYTDSPRRS
jgi:hypothetical protein